MIRSVLEKRIEKLVGELSDRLRAQEKTFSTAESCTCGMIASMIGDRPGVSDVFLGGIVSYSNDVKINVLGVPAEVIEEHGAVSEECAKYMAEGSRKVTGASLAVSVTGIAGPGGGVPGKPVGTVCFGVSDGGKTLTETVHFGPKLKRGEIRRLTVIHALEISVASLS